jgi:hypothetical protein
VIGFLRFVGIVNAAIWFGTAIFFTVSVAPAFFSPEMKRLLPAHHGAAAQIVLERYFIMQHICGAIALVHLLAEWLYTGKALERFSVWVVIAIFSLGLVGGLWLQPRLKELYVAKYYGASEQQKEAAGRSFGFWHGISQGMNLLMTAGIFIYFWRVANPGPNGRSTGASKYTTNLFRG